MKEEQRNRELSWRAIERELRGKCLAFNRLDGREGYDGKL